MLFLQLWPSDPPQAEEWFYPLVWPVILSVIGAYSYFRGAMMESYGTKAPYRVLGIPLCAIALFLGTLTIAKYFSDPLYQNVITSGRVKMAHEIAPLFGLGSLGAILWDRRKRALEKRKDDLFDRFSR